MTPFLLALSLLAGLPHAGSVSRTWIELQPESLQVRSELQILSLLEILPDLDANANGFVEPEEVTAHKATVERYLAAHYRLRLDGEALAMGSIGVRVLPPTPGSFLPIPEWVEVRWQAPIQAMPARIEVHSTLFASTSPDHRDLLSVRWTGHLSVSSVLDGMHPMADLEPGRRRLPLALRAALLAAYADGAGLFMALVVLLGWAGAGKRSRHGWWLVAGVCMSTLVHGLLGREAAQALYGAHLWPLAMPLLAAYCAADRVAFGVQAGHSLEAFAGGHLWGMSCSLAWLRTSAGWELRDWPWAGLPLMAPLLIVACVWLLARLLHERLQARAGRVLLGLAGALSLGLFALRALA
ncbi:MAG: hypothetical protein ACI9HE_003043 [Planctomycetota bacterium]